MRHRYLPLLVMIGGVAVGAEVVAIRWCERPQASTPAPIQRSVAYGFVPALARMGSVEPSMPRGAVKRFFNRRAYYLVPLQPSAQ